MTFVRSPAGVILAQAYAGLPRRWPWQGVRVGAPIVLRVAGPYFLDGGAGITAPKNRDKIRIGGKITAVVLKAAVIPARQ